MDPGSPSLLSSLSGSQRAAQSTVALKAQLKEVRREVPVLVGRPAGNGACGLQWELAWPGASSDWVTCMLVVLG
jgi:hypothetical protein